MPTAIRTPAAAARAVYIGLFASTLIVSGGALAVAISLDTLSTGTGPIDWLALLAGLGVQGIVLQRRNQLPRKESGVSLDLWWQSNAGAALILWALLEFSSLIGAVVLFATGQVTVFAVLAFLALSGLFLLSPARLESA